MRTKVRLSKDNSGVKGQVQPVFAVIAVAGFPNATCLRSFLLTKGMR